MGGGASITQGMETGQTIRIAMPSSAATDLTHSWGTTVPPTAAHQSVHPHTDRYIRDAFEHLGLPELADDPRFSTCCRSSRIGSAAAELIAEALAKPFEYWRRHLKTMRGQWAPFQSLVDLGTDEQALANDMAVLDRRDHAAQRFADPAERRLVLDHAPTIL